MVNCPKCGSQNKEESNYCVKCGNPMPSKPSGTSGPGQPPTPAPSKSGKANTAAIAAVAVVAIILIAAIATVAVLFSKGVIGKTSHSQTTASAEAKSKNGDTEKAKASDKKGEKETTTEITPNYYADSGTYGVVIKYSSSVNIREKPNKNSKSKISVPYNDIVTIIGYKDEYAPLTTIKDTWIYVEYEGVRGWTFQKYIATIELSTNQEDHWTVYAGGQRRVNLRYEPTTQKEKASKNGKIYDREYVKVKAWGIRESDGWAWVTYGGKYGWITTEALSRY